MASVLRAVIQRAVTSIGSVANTITRPAAVQSHHRCPTLADKTRRCFSSLSSLPRSTSISQRPACLYSLASSSQNFAPKSGILSAATKLSSPAVSVRCYHVRVALKKRCSSCYFVRRKGRLYVECKAKPRHKQMQVMSKRKTWKEDYSEGNVTRQIYWKYERDKGIYKLGDNQYARHDWHPNQEYNWTQT